MELRIETVDNDFKIFMATSQDCKECEPKIKNYSQKNLEYLLCNPTHEPLMPITGSFIYAHAPNYRGRPMIHANEREWEITLAGLQEMGMDTVIMQAALWAELNECYYPSSRFSGMKIFNVVEPILNATEKLGMKVYLGGYGSITGWRDDLSEEIITREKENQVACIRELLTLYGHHINGVYYSPETAFNGCRNYSKEIFLNDLYKKFCGTVKDFNSELSIIMSPATKYLPGKMEEMVECWAVILDNVPLDIMAPQDSVGCCGNYLEHQKDTFEIWSKICDTHDICLWSNIEIFVRKEKVDQINHSLPASSERIIAQINNAAPYVEKLICWEALYYPSEMCGNAGMMLRDFLRDCAKSKCQ